MAKKCDPNKAEQKEKCISVDDLKKKKSVGFQDPISYDRKMGFFI